MSSKNNRLRLGFLLLFPLTSAAFGAAERPFVRGDVDDDGTLDVSDVAVCLSYLFRGLPVHCPAAVDSNDDGGLDVSDAVYALRYLFARGPVLPAPFPDCGEDVTPSGHYCGVTRCSSGPGHEYDFPDKSGTQWRPCVEWAVTNPGHSGDAYDVVAAVTFTHSSSGETHTTEMFYDGSDTWKFRFTATRTGVWTFTTSSSDPDLDGKNGRAVIGGNPDPNPHGFIKKIVVSDTQGTRWGWEGPERAFVPQLVMYDSPASYYNDPAKIDRDIQDFFAEHGFNGFHTQVYGRWFDLESDGGVNSSMTEPDRRTFEALEQLITRVHRAGGLVHIWTWGDHSRQWTCRSLSGGMNGTVDRRLQRYICARLGPIPGWTMGYGFDLDEWVSASELEIWHDYMEDHLGWSHFLGGRPAGPNHGVDHSPWNAWNSSQDYSSYEHHQPDYNVYVAALREVVGQPVLSEDRFRIRVPSRYPEKDYTDEMTRRGLYISTMAGGVGNIWGTRYDHGDWTEGGGSWPYRIEDQIKTYATFFENRFLNNLERSNDITDGACLRHPSNTHYLFYKEDASSVEMDLSDMSGPQPAIAVDTKLAYAEIDLGIRPASSWTWSAPYRSDWTVAVGDFGVTILPTVILSPPVGTVFTPGQKVTATGSGQDLSWNVDRDNDGAGPLATGGGPSITFTVPSDTTAGQPIIVTLTGEGGTASRTYTVDDGRTPETLEFSAEADTYVYRSHPDTNYGNETSVAVGGGSAQREIFLRFDVTGLPAGATVTAAELRLTCSNGSVESGGTIRKFSPSNPEWNETRPTWSSPLSGSDASGDLYSLGAVRIGSSYAFQDLDSAISENGRVTFVIRSRFQDGAAYYSSEHGNPAQRPKLEVTYLAPR